MATGRGRRTLTIYKSSGRLRTKTGVLPGVDTRGAGGYVVAPPSRHASGNQYGFNFDAFEEDGDDIEHLRSPGAIPEWLLNRVQPDSGTNVSDPVVKSTSPHFADLVEAVDAALPFIDSDDYEIWLQVGMALHAGLRENGCRFWDAWSQSSDKFDPDDQKKTWESFGKSGGGITLRTLFHLAREAGFNGPIPKLNRGALEIAVRRPNRRAGKVDFELLVGGEVVRVSEVNIRSARGRKSSKEDLHEAAKRVSGLNDENTLDQLFGAAWMAAERVAIRILAAPPRPEQRGNSADLSPERIERLKNEAAKKRDEECEKRVAALTDLERKKAIELGESPDLLQLLVRAVERLGHVGEAENVAVTVLVYLSCRLREPLHVLVIGDSSAGKSNLTSKCSRAVPPELVFALTDMTPKYLAHIGTVELAGKAVVLGERELGDEELVAQKKKLLREMISEGHVTQGTVEGDGRTHHGITKLVVGPIASSETTTKSIIFPEDRNRKLILESDISEEQTKRVLEHIGRSFEGTRADLSAEELGTIHAMIRMLKRPSRVVVPFAPLMTSVLPSGMVEVRRLASQILGLISVCAFLHQMQRTAQDEGGNPLPWPRRQNGEHVLFAHPRDYELVARLINVHLGKVIRRTITAKEKQCLEKVQELVRGRGPHAPEPLGEFTTPEVVRLLSRSTGEDEDSRNVRKRLDSLVDKQAVELVARGGPQMANRYRLLITEGIPDEDTEGVGWTREITLPGLPQIRTCGTTASYVVDNIRCVM